MIYESTVVELIYLQEHLTLLSYCDLHSVVPLSDDRVIVITSRTAEQSSWHRKAVAKRISDRAAGLVPSR